MNQQRLGSTEVRLNCRRLSESTEVRFFRATVHKYTLLVIISWTEYYWYYGHRVLNNDNLV